MGEVVLLRPHASGVPVNASEADMQYYVCVSGTKVRTAENTIDIETYMPTHSLPHPHCLPRTQNTAYL